MENEVSSANFFLLRRTVITLTIRRMSVTWLDSFFLVPNSVENMVVTNTYNKGLEISYSINHKKN